MENKKSRLRVRFRQKGRIVRAPWYSFRKLLLASFLFIFLTFGSFVLWVSMTLPPMDIIEKAHTDLSTQVYSADGKLMRSLYDESNRVSVSLKDISPWAVKALISTEDQRFYSHPGVDVIALFAIVKDRIRGERRGASTITMQLARNLYDQVGKEQSIFRKLKEMTVAVILESKFTKNEILEHYLNTVQFYGNTYGIENASKHFFAKSARDLNPEEAAMLIGLLKATGTYNPRKHPEDSKSRRNEVLSNMYHAGYLDRVALDSLMPKDIVLADPTEVNDLGQAAYFTEHLREWLKGWCSANGYDPYRDGLKVYTTIDSRMQGYAEEAAAEHLSHLQGIFDKQISGKEAWRKDTTILTSVLGACDRYLSLKREGKDSTEIAENFQQPVKMRIFSYKGPIDTIMSPWDSLKYYARFLETGFVSIDPLNGHIKAWVGGIDQRFFKYDHVYKGKRQVGSTFKPFVYCAAFDNGYSPCEQELNQPVFFYNDQGQMIWSPKNADGKIGGYMTLRRGLATSTNLITARIMKAIGTQTVCEYAHNLGIISDLECVPSLCLGTTDLNVYELVGAYCTFANQGVWNRPMFVTRIEDKFGNVIQDFTTESRVAISPSTAYMMIDILKGVVNEAGGTGGRLRSIYKLGMPIGGKTGTTQNHSDGWFVGVTPYLVSGAWVGCASRKMRFSSISYGQGASLALPIFGLYMQKVYKDSTIALPKTDFVRPDDFAVELECARFVSKIKPVQDSLFRGNNSVLDVDND